ncbi:hypothetical protein [Streptomyces sp. NPDC002889]
MHKDRGDHHAGAAEPTGPGSRCFESAAPALPEATAEARRGTHS